MILVFLVSVKTVRAQAQVAVTETLISSATRQQWLVTFSPPKTESMLVSNKKKDRDYIPTV